MKNNKYVTGIFWDDKDLLDGIKEIQSKGIAIYDVRTPFPVHGLDDVLKLKRSRLPRLGFLAGAIGAIVAFWFQMWVFTESWPINFGGKPYLSVPSFIPVTFELAVLFAAISLVFGFLIRSGIGPGAPTIIFDERTSDDAFLVVILEDEDNGSERIQEVLTSVGAQEVKHVEPTKMQSDE
ncbi:DUF3341 domain-containing protein [Saccharicrinis fermentans]|uniref:Quinol:cytochrome c oxidoreductase membrane protein n=1 Tax=Saccharicrinis fermentans DSM 9555 = JCM 21142 TaxID=869213 RepID=W7Y293_9BACT|nr:DUF3341 domain-containing protein [Saccharicrinis fermentans]GAF01653.1 hypothetical protein JCM21142_267 [Saccharicrinis fermentans DSM 9555 = JCM 21142]